MELKQKHLALTVLALAMGIPPAPLAAQDVVPAHEEPRHHLVLDDARFRVLDVRIPPGDTTAFHLHDVPIAYVRIAPATVNAQVLGEPWAEAPRDSASPQSTVLVSWTETYTEEPLIHRVANADDHLFRLIAVLNRGSGDPTSDSDGLGTAGPVEGASRWFRNARLAIASNEEVHWAAHRRPVVAVLVSDGVVAVTSDGAWSEVREGVGAFFVLDAGVTATLENRSPDRASLVFVEVR